MKSFIRLNPERKNTREYQLQNVTGAGIPDVVTNLGDTETEVFRREGEDAILPCGLGSPVNLKDEVFDWKKKQQEVFFYEKGKHYNNGKRGQDPLFVGRVHLLPGGLQAGNASVVLSNVTQADGGVYSCYFPRRNLTRWIRLTVGADITEVFTREGDIAILPCALGSPVDLTDGAFDWKKGKQEVFFYIKGKDYNNGREGQDPHYVGRVHLLPGGLQAGNASVVLSGVIQADSAGIPEVVTNLGDTDTEVFTREGEDAILPCGLGSPVNLKDEVFDWKKEQQEVFFYEKGKHYNNGKPGQDPQFGGRVHLLPGGLQAGNASVILSSVTQADGGVYSCYFPRRKLTRWIRLTGTGFTGGTRLSCLDHSWGFLVSCPSCTVLQNVTATVAYCSSGIVTQPYTCWLFNIVSVYLLTSHSGAGIPEVVTNLGDTDTEVFRREGEDAILPCGLGSPVNLKDEVFDWKKEQQEVFFYEKGKHYDNGKRGQDPQFGGRVGLLPGGLQAGNASVILSSVTEADGGVYSCYFPRRKLTRWIRLTVERVPDHTPPNIRNAAGAGIPEVVTNLGDTDTEVFTREGEDAILPCGLGSPVNLKDAVFDWMKEQQEVFFYGKGQHYDNGMHGQDPQFGGRVGLLPGGLQAGNASVILSSVTQADGGVYSCYFPRRKLKRWIRLTVERVPDHTPPKIRKAVVEPRLRLEVVEAPPSSGSVRLSCVSRGGQPQPSGLEWQTPNGTVIPAEEAPPAASSDSDGRDSISQTVKVTEPGSYTCLARQQGVHPAVRDTIRVFGHWLTGDHEEVLGNGPWKAIAGADITEVFTREGDDAILPCALGSPVDLTDEAFDWKKGKQEVFFYRQGKDYNDGLGGQDPHYVGRVHLLPGGLQAVNASVVLSGVTPADSGVYNCVILAKRTQSKRDIRLTVVVEPRLRLEVVEASPSSGSVRLSCVSRGGQPQPSGLEWQTPNGTVIPAEEAPPAASSDGDGRYSISQTVKVTEPGSYTCLARQQGVHPAVRDTIRVFGHWLTGDRQEVLGNGPWKAIAGADITEVFTREGDDAILPCALGSPVDLTDEAFDWKKGKQEVFFYRQGKDYNDGLGGQDPHYVGRVHLLPGGLQAGNASVVLSGVTPADSGVYKCVILAKRTQSNRDIRLTVVVEPRLRLEVVEAPPSSGSVRLSCVSRGQPQPSGLEWQTPNGTVIPAEEAPPAASSDSDGRYSISQTVKVTEPGNYTCVARQQGVHPAVRGTIQVFVNWQSLTGDRGEVFWNGTRNALCVLSILSIMLSFGAKMYKCCAKKKNSKEGIV
ncbi:uncharacterized protein LOC130372857 [Gadus chalcogrammus]|uniref:uncharacterized protein LOC130372857 n=1 Tax=Gadus chalcogrammus TaxID=1042646 RepID=UPI0024C4A8BC|nr:uncharacterized protein LOC130372857 [Gadus chalcogrammus]